MSSGKEIRWIDLTNEEKKEVYRIRNAESARKSRQKKRCDEDKLEQTHEEYERRLDRLESTVDKMTNDLLQESRASSGRGGASAYGRTEIGPHSKPGPSTKSPSGAHGSAKTVKSDKSQSNKSRGKPTNGPGSSEDRPDWFGDAF